MLSCKEISRLVSASFERDLSFFEKMQLRIHLWLCKPCGCFASNMRTMRAAMRQFADGKDIPSQEDKPQH